MNFKLNDKFEESFQVTEKIYLGFIDLFNDTNILHTDHEFALQKNFRGKVMHGNILNGFLSFFIGECLPHKNVIIHSQQIQFKNPVYLNDVLKFEAVISELFDSVNAVEFKFNFINSGLKIVARGKIQIGMLL